MTFSSLVSPNVGTVIPGGTVGVIQLATSGLRTSYSGGATVGGSTAVVLGSYVLSSSPPKSTVTVVVNNTSNIVLTDGSGHTMVVSPADVLLEYAGAHQVVANQVEHFGLRLQVNTAANTPAGTYSTAKAGGSQLKLKVQSPANSSIYSFNVVATVQASPTPITLTKVQDLTFSRVFAGTGTSGTAGTVTVPPVGTASASGAPGPTLAPGNQAAPARFTVGGLANAKYNVTFDTASVTLSGALTVDTFTSSPSGTAGVLGAGGTQDLYVGATLHVPKDQPAGTYGGSFTVRVTYE